MTNNRRLDWEGCNNTRDLGGLLTQNGGLTCPGAVVRSDTPARLSAAGWAALYAYGIRTIISLRTDGMDDAIPDAAPRPADLTTINVAIEDLGDDEFLKTWAASNLWGTPLYYSDALQRWPLRHAAVIRAIAHAQPGGVLFHCVRGYDRTGIIALLLLAFAGVRPEEILADYELSADPERDELLAERKTSTREVILNTLASFDAEAYLRAAGLTDAELAAVRGRFVADPPAGEQ